MSARHPFAGRLRIPVLAAPMFLVSGPELVIAAARAGIAGSFPAPNARTVGELDRWCETITSALGSDGCWAVNLIAHRTYDRLPAELAAIRRYRAPLVITALGSPARVLDDVHAYGGVVYADVPSPQLAEKAAVAGADGLVLVAAGAGGHTGRYSPFALAADVRSFWDGPLVIAGGVSDGRAIVACEALGADLVYIGTRFIATHESLVDDAYRAMLVEAQMQDIVLSTQVTGVPANWLRASLEQAGHLAEPHAAADFSGEIASDRKAWKHIWSAGHGVGRVSRVASVQEIVDELAAEHAKACAAPTRRAAA